MVRLWHCRLACSHFIKRWLHIFIFKHCEIALCCYIRETATARTDVEWMRRGSGHQRAKGIALMPHLVFLAWILPSEVDSFSASSACLQSCTREKRECQ
jgi:hypothetical protein